MSSQAQITANRKNAQKSTGPQTPQGKAAVALNALKHGLTANRDVVITENQADFDLHRDALMEELDPRTMTESILATRIVSLSWRLQRAVNIQDQAIDAIHDQLKNGERYPCRGPEEQRLDPALALGRIVYHDFVNEKVFERLLTYENRIESALYKTIKQLKTLQNQATAPQTIRSAQHLASGFTGGLPSPEEALSNATEKDLPNTVEEALPNTTSDMLHTTFAHTPDRKLAHKGGTGYSQTDHSPNAPVPEIVNNQSSIVNTNIPTLVPSCLSGNDSISQNKPNSKIPQTTPTTLMQRIYRHTATNAQEENKPNPVAPKPKV